MLVTRCQTLCLAIALVSNAAVSAAEESRETVPATNPVSAKGGESLLPTSDPTITLPTKDAAAPSPINDATTPVPAKDPIVPVPTDDSTAPKAKSATVPSPAKAVAVPPAKGAVPPLARKENRLNGWILTQAKLFNLAQSSEPAKPKWIGSYIYCSVDGYRIDTSGEDGLVTFAKTNDRNVYTCFSKNKTYTIGLEPMGRSTAGETELQGDERRYYTVSQVKGKSPTIAGLRTKHYQKYYHPYWNSNGCIYQGTFYRDLPEPSSEWFTADPQFLPAELKTATKSWGQAELKLRNFNPVMGPASGKSNEADGTFDSAKRLYMITNPRVLLRKELSFDTLSWKRATIPATAFEVPAGYRFLPPPEFAKQLTPGWILELDRQNPKDKRVFSH